MRTLVTGATGLIGANLVRRVARDGTRCRVLLPPGARRRRSLAGVDVEAVPGDVRDAHSLAKAMVGVTRVYHAAGHVRFDDAGRLLLWSINVEGTRQVLQAARSAGVERLVHVSSSVAVGSGPLNEPATEDSAQRAGGTPYAESKRASEALAAGDWGELGVVIANPTFVVGAYGTGANSAEVVRLVASGLLRAYPPGGTNFVNADDVADGLVLAMERGTPGERYLLGGENLTYRSFLGQVAEECGVAPPAVPLPGWAARGLGRAGDVLGRLSSARLGWVNTPFLEGLFDAAYVSSAKAERGLQYRPRPVRRGIREALRWYQEQRLLPPDRPLTPRGVVEPGGPG